MHQAGKLTLRDTSFVDLMQKRIFNVLIVANPYDAFMLEDDGRVDEKIFSEYTKLGLRFPPRFIQVASSEKAEETIARIGVNLIICMPGTDGSSIFDIARGIKNGHPDIPIVVLTPFSHGITKRMQDEDLSAFEYVFCWLGNTELLLSIIKLIEDRMNLEHDTEAGVQMILLVEDSIRFYSSILPMLYRFVLQQSLAFATEALNTSLETLRMRGRPKIVLARTYREAWELYSKYADNLLGVISDCRFPMNVWYPSAMDPRAEELNPTAGLQLLKEIHADSPYTPLIMNSSETSNQEAAHNIGAHFIDKNSKAIEHELRKHMRRYFGFGDFVFRDPRTMQEVARIHNLKELQDSIMTLPSDSLHYHISHNNVSRWLASRAIFPVAEFLKRITWDRLQDVDAHRQIIFDAIVAYRRMKNQGVVAVYQRDRFDQYSNFARIGDGSLGGKGRGLAFLDRLLKDKNSDLLMIPKTLVLCTDIFDEFIENNDLYGIALSDSSDEDILRAFLEAKLPEHLLGDLKAFQDVVGGPLAVRSSSLLEDSHYQPFAGIYSTYMVRYDKDDDPESPRCNLRRLAEAIKGVYASAYYRSSKDYMTATSNVIDQEKMAVILQEVVGEQHGERFYPTISGVARSINYYPIDNERAEEGIVSLAMGLGKHIVDGGTTLRVCPAHPEHVLQMSEMEIALRDTQTSFLALNTIESDHNMSVDDGFNLVRIPVREAEDDGTLQWICSTFDPQDGRIYDGYYEGRNRKIISFAGVLKNNVFPLPELLQEVLKMGGEAMRRPVEIEFAVNLHQDKTGEFYLLQIRPMVDNRMQLEEDLSAIPDDDCLLRSHNAIGFGIFDDISDVIYVPSVGFTPASNTEIAEEVDKINRKLLGEGRKCLLIGPGRWGTSDPWLGIPVKWPHISSAQVIAEAGLDCMQVDPSQGTHFFQNLTSLGVGYLTINATIGDGFWREELLNAMPSEMETRHVRLVHFDAPLNIKIDGRKKEAVVTIPGKNNKETKNS